jgi:hypothetical protein
MRQLIWSTTVAIVAACGGKQPSAATTVETFEEIWTASVATDGSCVAVPHCVPLTGAACTDDAPVGDVQFANVSCVPQAASWRIVERSNDHSCRIASITCTTPGCDANLERALVCPDFPKRVAGTLPADPTVPATRWWEQPNACPAGTKLEHTGRAGELSSYACMKACGEGDPDCVAREDGPSTTLWPSGQLLATGRYRDGDRIGTWMLGYDNGEPLARGSYGESGIENADWHFFVGGAPAFFEPNGAGCPAGTKLAGEHDGTLPVDVWCEDASGAKQGPAFSLRGFDQVIAHYEQGVRVDRSTHWNRATGWRNEDELVAGRRVRSADYFGRKMHDYEQRADGSVYERWFRPNGKLERDETSRDNCRDGVSSQYDAHGVLVARAVYKNCKLVSRAETWHCMDAKQLVHPEDLSPAPMTSTRIGAETPEQSSVRLRASTEEVALHLWKSSFDDAEHRYMTLLDLADPHTPGGEDEVASRSARITVDKLPGILFLDATIGAVVEVGCSPVLCPNERSLLALARMIEHRIATDRSCQKP